MGTSISVVIPVYNSAAYLRQCLEHLKSSIRPPDEIIVVNDGSTDGSEQVATDGEAIVLRSGRRCGPARARNLGAQRASGDVLFFIDADVLVRPDTVLRVEQAFEQDSELAALIGSYDDDPEARDFLSQYRNLMHHFTHQQARREACTFWSGCGAIRRAAFLKHGGFDESYDRPAIEDIELGYRLSRAGAKMTLDRDMQVKHLKRWTFWKLIKADILDRGIPWTELILRDRRMPNDLNVQLSQRVSVALVFLSCGLSLAAAIHWRGYFLTPLFAMLFLALGRFWCEHASRNEWRRGMIWAMVSLAALVVAALAHDMPGLVPPLGIGCLLLTLHHRYEYAAPKRQRHTRWMLIVVFCLVAALSALYLPNHMVIFSLLVVIVAAMYLNSQFYLFLAGKRNRTFAAAAVPFHLLYHFYCGLSFVAGAVRYALRSPARANRPKPKPMAAEKGRAAAAGAGAAASGEAAPAPSGLFSRL